VGEELKQEYELSLFKLFGKPDAHEVQALDAPKVVDGVSYSTALVKSETTKDWMLYFAPDGSLARMDYVGDSPSGAPAKWTRIYDNWTAVEAIRYPFADKALIDDKPMVEGKVLSLTLNPELADDLFKKPSQ
jgi:hypothetical protein